MEAGGYHFLLSLCFPKDSRCHFVCLFFPFSRVPSLCSSQWAFSSLLFLPCESWRASSFFLPFFFFSFFFFPFHFFFSFSIFYLFLVSAIFALPSATFQSTSTSQRVASILPGALVFTFNDLFLAAATQGMSLDCLALEARELAFLGSM